MKTIATICGLLFCISCFSQQSDTTGVDFDVVDSLIATTPEIEMCMKDGKEDLRFFSKVPEKYSEFKQKFTEQALGAINIPAGNRFRCELSAEINCKGKAGNYTFGLEPRNFSSSDFDVLTQLITLVNSLRDTEFKPAYYLGENVNSKASFKLSVKDGKLVMQ